MKIIDLDSHSEPRGQDYDIGPQYLHLRPRVYVDAKGNLRELFHNKVMKIAHGGQQTLAASEGKHRAGEYDGSVRYEQITAAEIDFQFITAGNNTMFSYIDSKVGAAFCKAYNNFLYEKFMCPYPNTFSGLPQLPLQDVSEAIKELERCVENLGMRSFIMPTNWNGIDMADPYWWNFYERVRDLGITAIFVHIESLSPDSPWVGKERLAVLGPDGTRGRRILSHPFENCTNIVNLMFGGMMDAFPEFRFAFLKVGASFATVLKHRIKENLKRVPYLRDMLTQPLENYFDRFYFPVEDLLEADDNGKLLRYAIEVLGAEHLFFGSNYPRSGGNMDLSAVSPEVKEKILGGNAVALMGGKLP